MKGLDDFVRKLQELERAAAALDGDIAEVRFDPSDPQSIDLAINKIEAAVDERIAGYGSNDMVQGIAQQLKEQARNAIMERAAAARTRNREGEGEGARISDA